jgi:hypothetical protein
MGRREEEKRTREEEDGSFVYISDGSFPAKISKYQQWYEMAGTASLSLY